ncbi:MAG TPA: class I SAM-dependent methyltransferase [Bryobacteraceae bacterium]|jgi:SAM-dependent methyltransferase|nr:class I SAM-dependent methyltransferase [Bryobacteraceae bacterium]
MTAAQAFNALAASYDRCWTRAPIGRLQREAFWRHAAPYFTNARRVLDLGCGTGEDALRLIRSGISVYAIDASPEMVSIARARGVDARVLAIEQAGSLNENFDVVLSNFGALNCVADLAKIPFARLLKPGGYAVLCLLGRFCLWETIWFLLHADPRRAARRWRGRDTTRGGFPIFYHRPRAAQLSAELSLVAQAGIGLAVPPSYMGRVPDSLLRAAARLDRHLAARPLFRSIADHTLFIFKRS